MDRTRGRALHAFLRFDVDLTYVTHSGGEKEDRYWSLGFHLETEPFLP